MEESGGLKLSWSAISQSVLATLLIGAILGLFAMRDSVNANAAFVERMSTAGATTPGAISRMEFDRELAQLRREFELQLDNTNERVGTLVVESEQTRIRLRALEGRQ